ncbi:hypothetical protein, partial [Paraburkholderia humisilvae]|uniref:hypothetical protein n=1 Tax=Paraburkholderia humisilvae TaxID=627669 RepID=UPI0035E46C95
SQAGFVRLRLHNLPGLRSPIPASQHYRQCPQSFWAAHASAEPPIHQAPHPHLYAFGIAKLIWIPNVDRIHLEKQTAVRVAVDQQLRIA